MTAVDGVAVAVVLVLALLTVWAGVSVAEVVCQPGPLNVATTVWGEPGAVTDRKSPRSVFGLNLATPLASTFLTKITAPLSTLNVTVSRVGSTKVPGSGVTVAVNSTFWP